MRTVKIFCAGKGKPHEFNVSVPQSVLDACYDLPKDACRFAYWRRITGERRIKGHAMVWFPIDAPETVEKVITAKGAAEPDLIEDNWLA